MVERYKWTLIDVGILYLLGCFGAMSFDLSDWPTWLRTLIGLIAVINEARRD